MQVRERRAQKHHRGRGGKVFRVKCRQDRANIMQDKRTALVIKGTGRRERIKTVAAAQTELLSHMLPHVRLWQAGDRELLYISVS